MEYIIKIVKSVKDSGFLLKGVSEAVQNKVNEKKRRLLSMLLGTLGASLLGNILASKGINRAGKGQKINKAGKGRGINRTSEGIVRAGCGHRSSKRMDSQCRLILWQILIYKNIIKINLDLMVFILEIIYPK